VTPDPSIADCLRLADKVNTSGGPASQLYATDLPTEAAALRVLAAGVRVVLELHVPFVPTPFPTLHCVHCPERWPCTTVRALGVTE
jgi:hypothetical protein